MHEQRLQSILANKMRRILALFLFFSFLNFTQSRQKKHLKLLHKVCDLNAFCYDDEKPFVLVKEDDKTCPEQDDELPKTRKRNRNRNENEEDLLDIIPFSHPAM